MKRLQKFVSTKVAARNSALNIAGGVKVDVFVRCRCVCNGCALWLVAARAVAGLVGGGVCVHWPLWRLIRTSNAFLRHSALQLVVRQRRAR